jgi:uncharacterized protein Yka (UPF0111/DUF47 family)
MTSQPLDRAGDTETAVRERTDACVDAVEECVALLPAVLDRYGDPEGVDAAVAALGDAESRCDDRCRDLQRHLSASLVPSFTGYYLRNADLVSLVSTLDAVTTAAERFGKEFGATDPTLDPASVEAFRAHAATTVEATALFSEAARRYVDALDGDAAPAFDGAIVRIRELEEDCDDLKYALVERSFERHDPAPAHVRKDLAVTADAVPNAVEDAADHLVYAAAKLI